MTTKFVHLRNIEEDPNSPFNEPVTVISPRGGITVAIEDRGDHWLAAQAMCHPKDNYCKHLGRVKASGRLRSRDGATIFGKDAVGHSLKEAVDAISQFYLDMKDISYVNHGFRPV